MEKKLRELIKNAMIAKDKQSQTTYKNILEKAQKAAKDDKSEINDTYIINAAKKEIKQINDLLEYCEVGSDRYNECKKNIQLCEELLPQMASEDDILNYLSESNLEKNMGICMKALKSKFGDALDGKIASMTVKKYIAN